MVASEREEREFRERLTLPRFLGSCCCAPCTALGILSWQIWPPQKLRHLSQSLNLVSPAAGAVTPLGGWDRAAPAAAQHWGLLWTPQAAELSPVPMCQCCCAGICWDKCTPQSTSVIDVYGNFVKCHLFGVFQCLYWWYVVFFWFDSFFLLISF